MVSPESAFFHRLLDNAHQMCPVGSVAFRSEDVNIELPEWLIESRIQTGVGNFSPYYDRSALCVLFHVGVETVSEYQTAVLRAVTVDLRADRTLPGLTESYLSLTDCERASLSSDELGVDRQSLRNAVDEAFIDVETQVSPAIDEIREQASRAAVEVDEFRELQEQRIDELSEQIVSLNERVQNRSETINDTDNHHERVEALRERKELNEELRECITEHEELTSRKESGFPKRRTDIYERHALSVNIRPVVLTVVTYEKGELTVTLRQNDTDHTLRLAYGTGAGVTDTTSCAGCDTPLSAENPAALVEDQLYGSGCCGML